MTNTLLIAIGMLMGVSRIFILGYNQQTGIAIIPETLITVLYFLSMILLPIGLAKEAEKRGWI